VPDHREGKHLQKQDDAGDWTLATQTGGEQEGEDVRRARSDSSAEEDNSRWERTFGRGPNDEVQSSARTVRRDKRPLRGITGKRDTRKGDEAIRLAR
jgi:hypothetical protein